MTSEIRDPYISANGKLLLTAEALISPFNDGEQAKVGQYAILADDLKGYYQRGQGVQIAQLYELVIPGLILSRHIFCGLRRRLFSDGEEHADESKLVYSRVPSFDAVIERGGSAGNPNVLKVEAPKGQTFVVVISPNIRHRDKYPTIDGWLNHWNWVPQDTGLPEAPDNWLDRYDKKLYSGD